MNLVQFLSKHCIRRFQIFLLALTVVTAVACADDSDQQKPSPVFSGLVIGFAQKSLLEFESVRVVDEAGRVMEFHSGGHRFPHFTPSHLREHMVMGHGVVVSYKEDGGMFYIVDITDAPVGETPGPS